MDWENKGYRAKEKNMNKATLVVMAAGIGSRFGGGIKQLEPVGPNGEIIMDMSIPELEAFKKKMKNELPGRVEIQKEEIKADDESGKNETEEENKY